MCKTRTQKKCDCKSAAFSSVSPVLVACVVDNERKAACMCTEGEECNKKRAACLNKIGSACLLALCAQGECFVYVRRCSSPQERRAWAGVRS
eukprot:6204495-Pleurochrysis_carterae.AAC.2